MNLVKLLNGRSIEGFSYDEFKDILSYRSDITVKSAAHGLLLFSDNSVVKCVRDYYEHPQKKKMKAIKITNVCHAVHSHLEINRVGANDCRSCHMSCLNRLATNELKRKVK